MQGCISEYMAEMFRNISFECKDDIWCETCERKEVIKTNKNLGHFMKFTVQSLISD